MKFRKRSMLAVLFVIPQLIGCAADDARTAISYPLTKTVEVVDDYHGTKVADPYRWLERLDAPEVRKWAAAQSAFTTKNLDADSPHRALVERMRVLGSGWDSLDVETSLLRKGGYEFSYAPAGALKHPVLSARDARGVVRVLADPRRYGPDMSIPDFLVSPDARHVVYQLSNGGSEWTTTRVAHTATGNDVGDSLSGMLFEAPVWSADGEGFFYVHQYAPGPADGFALRGPSVRYHRLKTPQANDRVLFRTPEQSVDLVLQASLTDDHRFLVISEGNGAHWENFSWVLSRLHVLDLGTTSTPQLTGTAVALSATRDAGYRVIQSTGSVLQVMTDRGASRKRLVSIDMRNPVPENWREIIPERAGVLQDVIPTQRGYIGVYLDSLRPVIRAFDKTGRLIRELPQHPISSITAVSAEGDGDSVRVDVSTLWDVLLRTQYDIATGNATTLKRITGSADSAYEASRVWFKSKDGARIPMLIVHRKGMALDGSHAVLMLGYGASGSSMLPSYAEHVMAWLELGGVFAMPNVRGGGEFGRDWYEAAILERKQKTFDDFIAAAEFLIGARYTAAGKIAINGASNGGQLVAAAMTQRPDLFGAAVLEVPLTDLIHWDRGRHRAQFGWSGNPDQFKFLYAYSPLHQVKAGTCYPATLIMTSMNDNRAPAWHSFKFGAALQAAQGCDRPIFIRAHDIGGHFAERGPDSFLEDRADLLTFAARYTGLIAR